MGLTVSFKLRFDVYVRQAFKSLSWAYLINCHIVSRETIKKNYHNVSRETIKNK